MMSQGGAESQRNIKLPTQEAKGERALGAALLQDLNFFP
jgi:hypothetical protein